MVTSGKSGVSARTTAPTVRREPATSADTVGSGLARVEDEPELADLHLVARRQPDLVDELAVDVCAVERADVVHHEGTLGAAEDGVLARHGDVVEEDVAVGVTAGHHLVVVEEEPRAGVGTA